MAAYHPALLKPLASQKTVIFSFVFAFLYLLIQIYTLNYRLVSQTLSGVFPSTYKLQVLWDLIQGYFVMFPPLEVLFNVITAILVGFNLMLIIVLAQTAKKTGSMKLTVGGTSILTLAGAGCPTCGVTVLSFLGPSSSFAGILLHSMVIQAVVVIILLASVLHSLKRLQASKVCKR